MDRNNFWRLSLTGIARCLEDILLFDIIVCTFKSGRFRKNKSMYSSIQTFANLTVFMPCVSRLFGNLQVDWTVHYSLKFLSFPKKYSLIGMKITEYVANTTTRDRLNRSSTLKNYFICKYVSEFRLQLFSKTNRYP